ncbi:MAG: ABC transporter ATP-binding protein [Acetobacteraceae bacterium]|nr:ABC transporter ATP-binding protein [Acetobacteraceae bacterium]
MDIHPVNWDQALAKPKLRAHQLSKRYGTVTALEPVDLTVASGELLTVLGPSGSGKTTLLHIVSGLVEPSAGTIYIDGHDHTHTPVHRRDIGMVFQSYALFPHLTVEENVAFPLRMRHRSDAEVRRRVTQALEMVQLGHLAHRMPRALSGGQQQRVALARCFVYQPSIILMDEPPGALDKKLREHMQIEIKRLHRDTGVTIIYVTHDQEEALALSDRICLMNHARIEQIGTPQQIYERPATAFAADFIGISNIFHGKIAGTMLETPDGIFALPAGAPPNLGAGQAAALVVRPEHMRLGPDADCCVTGRVAEAVYAGSATRLIATMASGTELTVRLPAPSGAVEIGATAQIGWNRENSTLVLT